MRLLLLLLLAACGSVDEGDDVSIFRPRNAPILPATSSSQLAPEVRTEDELRAAIGAAVDPVTGNSLGKAIRLASTTITLESGPLVFGNAQTGLHIIGLNSTLRAPGDGPVLAFDDLGAVTRVVFDSVVFSVENATGSNGAVEAGATFPVSATFFDCRFEGSSHSLLLPAASLSDHECSMLMCRDATPLGVLGENTGGRFIGNRFSANGTAIVLTGGIRNVISGNALFNSIVDTSASGGSNTVTGNTALNAASAFHGADNTTGGNT